MKIKTKATGIENLQLLISKNFVKYFNLIFGILDKTVVVSDNGITFVKDKKSEKEKIKSIINEWNKEIKGYSTNFQKVFNINALQRYKRDLNSFKKNIFAKIPWTVNAALKTPDEELIKYRVAFSSSLPDQIYNTVYTILTSADTYIKNHENIFNSNIINENELELDFLEEDNMMLTGVIGYGIRSELLHRFYPKYFSIMTRRNIWGMFFLTNNCEEFIRMEEDKEKNIRTTHEWEYNYAKFNILNNYLFNIMKEYINNFYDIKLDDSLRFGYPGKFLNNISKYHQNEIDLLIQWKKNYE